MSASGWEEAPDTALKMHPKMPLPNRCIVSGYVNIFLSACLSLKGRIICLRRPGSLPDILHRSLELSRSTTVNPEVGRPLRHEMKRHVLVPTAVAMVTPDPVPVEQAVGCSFQDDAIHL